MVYPMINLIRKPNKDRRMFIEGSPKTDHTDSHRQLIRHAGRSITPLRAGFDLKPPEISPLPSLSLSIRKRPTPLPAHYFFFFFNMRTYHG